MELGPEDVSLLERCPHFRGCYVQASMELVPEDMSLLERCPHFRGCYVQASMELGPEDVSLLERCPHFRGCYVHSSTAYSTFVLDMSEMNCHPLGHCILLWPSRSNTLAYTHTIDLYFTCTCSTCMYACAMFIFTVEPLYKDAP